MSPTENDTFAGIDEPLHIKRRKVIKPGFTHSPWKSAYIRQHRIDTNWRRGDLKSPKVVCVCVCIHFYLHSYFTGTFLIVSCEVDFTVHKPVLNEISSVYPICLKRHCTWHRERVHLYLNITGNIKYRK